jgi:hypothetical protein
LSVVIFARRAVSMVGWFAMCVLSGRWRDLTSRKIDCKRNLTCGKG